MLIDSEKIVNLMDALGLSIDDVAQLAKCSRSTVTRVKTNNHSRGFDRYRFSTVCKLARALGVKSRDLILKEA